MLNRVKLIAYLIKSGNVHTARCEAIGINTLSALEHKIISLACEEANHKYGCKLDPNSFSA